MRKDVSAFSFLLGFSAAVSQVLVMRVLVATLYGNEFIFVLVLVGWMLGIALGSGSFGFIRRDATPWRRMASLLFVVTGMVLPLTTLLIRFVRNILGIAPGMLMDLLPAAGTVLVVVLPLSFLYGALFPILVGWNRSAGILDGAARVYALEAAGFVAGGIVVTFLLLPFFNTMTIACLVLGLHVMVIALFVSRPVSFPVVIGLAVALLLASGYLQRLDWRGQAAQWKGYGVLENRDTVYGNLQLLEKDKEKSLFENGLHVATTGDALSSEESVHYSLLAHPAPRRLLLIGGGLAGGLKEALKHPGLSVDYVELDPAAIDMVRRQIPEVAVTMSDSRVRLIIADGRRFIRKTQRAYDVIIVNLSDPFTLLINRYYTAEFFREVQRHLSPAGVLALTVTASENYLNKEGRDYLSTVRGTLVAVFAEVRTIPGDRYIFLASNALGVISVDPAVLAARLKERGVRTKYVREYFFNFRLALGRIAEVERNLLGNVSINTDTRPATFLAALVFWSTHFRSGLSDMVQWFKLNGLVSFSFPVLIGLVVAAGRRRRLLVSGSIVGVAGFCLMIYQLAVIMAFQSFYGYVYAGVGLITAAFMAGALVGASYVADRIRGERAEKLRRVAMCSALFSLAVSVAIFRISMWGSDEVVLGCLALFSVAAGCLGGVQFALAVKYAGEDASNSGILYAIDVLGAAVGALVGGILVIPLWGVEAAGCFCALLQAAVWVGLLYPAR